jgi:putative intracellular protease/amidase
MRKLIHEADPNILEEWKWMGTPVWSHDGIMCNGEAGGIYEDKDVVVDGNLITSRWPMDLPAFMQEIVRKLNAAHK